MSRSRPARAATRRIRPAVDRGRRRRLLLTALALVVTVALISGCASSAPAQTGSGGGNALASAQKGAGHEHSAAHPGGMSALHAAMQKCGGVAAAAGVTR